MGGQGRRQHIYALGVQGNERGHTSGGLSPGRSENLNKSYAFAQMSASGKISNASTAVSSDRMGCRSTESSEFSIAANDASMSRNWASRETSIATSLFCLLSRGRTRKGHRSGRADARDAETAYISCETLGRMLPSRLKYSVFRSHGTCGTEDNGVEVPDEGPAPRTGPADAGSPNRNWSFGSSLGRLLGSGFSSLTRKGAGTVSLESWKCTKSEPRT